MRSRVEEAVKMFESGYNCAQAVFTTYANIFGMERDMALRLSCPLGGGMGRMREVCGTVTAMSLLEGLKEGNTDSANEEAKAEVYGRVRELSAEFKRQHGSILCRELLHLDACEKSPVPDKRTAEYYAKRPCSQLVASAAKIIEEQLLEDMD